MDREREPESIPYFLHEGIMTRAERNHRRTVVLLCIVMALLVAFAATETILRHRENRAWLDYIGQYDFEEYDYTQDGQGVNIIGNLNGVNTNVAAPESAEADEKEP